MHRFCTLPFRFDPTRLLNDLRQVEAAAGWIPHFVPRNYQGDWSAIPLRSVGGAPDHVCSDPAVAPEEYRDTEYLASAPYFREALAAFACPLTSVRLLKLAAGSRINEHVDLDLSVERGTVRLHIPITTHPDVEFYVEDERAVMEAGSCWYLDATLPHRLSNPSPVDRVHIVFDCVMNDWLRERFDEAGYAPREKGFLEQRGIRKEDLPQVLAALRAMEGGVGAQIADELERGARKEAECAAL